MEEYLRRVDCRHGTPVSQKSVHAVLGGPEADVDTVAATLCLALHLNQREPSGGVCVPLLCGQRGDAALPWETALYLQRVKVCESLLLWKDDVDLVESHQAGKLSLTLLRDGLLDSTERHLFESSILRVVHHDSERDPGDDGLASAVMTVARELLQEAPERIGAPLRESLGEALRLQSEAFCLKHGCQSAQLEGLMRRLQPWSDVSARPHSKWALPDLEHLLSKELREFSDGEMTIALASVAVGEERWRDCEDVLKSFCNRHHYDGLLVLLSVSDSLHPPRQQAAVYSSNADLLSQICCELEETSSWSLSGEPEARACFQVYHSPLNNPSSSGTLLLEEEVRCLLKEFMDRRCSVLACHPTSRTSSTEGVAGSVEFSQGSSGINDMDGSDTERGEGAVVAIERGVAEGEEDTGGGGAVGELLSPDSGMNTIRSSRSSKESSVFLSDDSPVGEILGAGLGGFLLRNPSPLGLSSLSPPVPPERRSRRSSKKRIDHLDQFSFDVLHPQPILPNPGGKLDDDRQTAGSSSLSEYEELNMLDFSAPSSFGGLESRQSSTDPDGQIHGVEMMDTVVPPTPVNSLVGSHPSSSCGVRFFPEDVVERISGLQHKDSVSSSLSETWEELGFDPPSSNDTWNRTRESPQNLEDVRHKDSEGGMTGRRREGRSQRDMSLEPQLSLITEQTDSQDNWNPDSVLRDPWNSMTVADLQLTTPDEEVLRKDKEVKKTSQKRKIAPKTLTPDTSQEDDEEARGNKGSKQTLDFWTYSAQKGFLKSDSGTTTSYPESLDMWNMTIRDDSFSPLTTPDNLSEDSGSFCGATLTAGAGASVESPQGFPNGGMAMWNTTIQEDSSSSASPEGPANDSSSHTSIWDGRDTFKLQAGQASGIKCNSQLQNLQIVIEEEGSISHRSELVSVPRMVISTSEYDNVRANSLSSSPEAQTSLALDSIHLEEQSSPFIAVTKPTDQRTRQMGVSDKVFVFEGHSELSDMSKSNSKLANNDSVEQPSLGSPFILVDNSQAEDSLSPSPWSFRSPEPAPPSNCPTGSLAHVDSQSQEVPVEGSMRDMVSLSPGGGRETLKSSPDSLHPGSQDELRSNSDGDSSSGLEMEYIIVPGTVKEAERERGHRGSRKPMETFSMLAYAASVLKNHTQDPTEKTRQTQVTQQFQTEHEAGSTCGARKSSQTSKQSHPPQSKTEAFHQSESRQEIQEGNYEDKPGSVGRSMSPSLRHPSDHFLKTREEVYVRSQISMEDSDSDSGRSPAATTPPPHPTSPGNFHVWRAPSPRHYTPQSSCDSPSLSNSSASHTSSLVTTPVSESGGPGNKALGLPFSGDLMEEENDEEDADIDQPMSRLSSHDLLSFTQELVGACQLEPTSGMFQEQILDYYEHTERTDGSTNLQHQIGGHQSYSTVLGTEKPEGGDLRRSASDVYAEFTTGAPTPTERPESYSEPRCGQYEQPDRQDHARYVAEGYAHFLMSRSHHEDGAAAVMMMMGRTSSEEVEDTENREDPPSSADVSAGSSQRRKLAAPPMNLSLERSEGSLLSEDALDTEEEDEALDTGDDLDVNLEELDTSDEEFNTHGDSEGSSVAAGGGADDGRLWRSVVIGEQEHRIDMKCIEAYKRVVSHGGYYAEQNAIIVFAACFLPDSDCDNYHYVMENLFLYVISTLELMVAEDYMIVYLNGATPRRRMPGFTWMKKCYQMIDRRLKKNLKMFVIVHPSWFIRTLLGITRPFISSKFSSKIKYVSSLQELGEIIPMEYVHIPPSIVKLDTDLKETAGKADRKRSLAV